ncbi:hypothetical protein ICL81_00505 [Leucobacter sp. cx-328]|uniref:hypothetical protein n=1 Tax=unclassified Leucobacter TaxID=2621730 RepID=UPI00165E7E80|nr:MULTISPECIES: hypothetical protein [unclassified Leucobacter]MBC9943009.1 hypothetical protein [Leucobacter sp. cx-328]
MTKTLFRYLCVGLSGLVLFSTASCSDAGNEKYWGNGATSVEQRRWIGAQFELVIGVIGIERGWVQGYDPQLVEWRNDAASRGRILDSFGPGTCSKRFSDDIERMNFIGLLKNSEFVGDASDALRNVESLLTASGWVAKYSEGPSVGEAVVRAIRDDGAGIDLHSLKRGLTLSVTSPCSSMPYDFGGLDRDTVPSVLDPVVNDFRRLPNTKEERAAWSPMQRDPKEEQLNRELEEEPKR